MSVEYEEDYFNKTGYELGYQDYPAHIGRVLRMMIMANPKSVLDVGCAYGYIVQKLRALGVYAVGCDVSRYAGLRSREVIPGCFIRADLRRGLPFKNNSFDLLYCEGVLEHIEEEYIDYIMAEFERVAFERILQVGLEEHPNSSESEGHVCLHEHGWWYEKMPMQTWLALQPVATEANEAWLYKG